jgi:hypothetical protein
MESVPRDCPPADRSKGAKEEHILARLEEVKKSHAFGNMNVVGCSHTMLRMNSLPWVPSMSCRPLAIRKLAILVSAAIVVFILSMTTVRAELAMAVAGNMYSKLIPERVQPEPCAKAMLENSGASEAKASKSFKTAEFAFINAAPDSITTE